MKKLYEVAINRPYKIFIKEPMEGLLLPPMPEVDGRGLLGTTMTHVPGPRNTLISPED